MATDLLDDYQRAIRLVVYHNPFADRPLSLDVFDGEFDEQFAANEEGLYERVFVGALVASL
jgi:hypothetical protein